MIKTWSFVSIFGISLFFLIFYPIVAYFMVASLLCIFFLAIKFSGLESLMVPVGKARTLVLKFTKKRTIRLETWIDKAEGYLAQPRWGTIKIIDQSGFMFHGKPCVLAIEGVAHSARIEDILTAYLLQRSGVHTKAELKKALSIETPKSKAKKPAKKR